MVLQTRPKPNASYASNRLTRHDQIGKSLLSSFRDRPKSVKPEPATDDEPLSSSEDDDKTTVDDDDELSEEGTRPRVSRLGLEEKLAQSSSPDGGRTPRASRQQRNETKNAGEPASSRKRTSREMAGDGDEKTPEDGGFWNSFRNLDQGHKRRKPAVSYQSRKSFGEAPISSLTEPEPEPEPELSVKSKSSKKNLKVSKKKSKKSKKEEETEAEAQTPKPQFKVPREIEGMRASSPKPQFKQPPPMPNDLISSSSYAPSSARDAVVFDDDDSSIGTPLSTASSTLMNELSQYDDVLKDAEPVLSEPSVCPWCKAPVEPGLLLQFRAQPKQRMREQQRFCDSHKQSSAEQEWKEKGYPAIDWDGFEERINRHFADLETIMVPETSSFYRNLLDSTMKAGQAKNFRLTLDGDGLENISCGYYGTRGAGKMLQAITTRYGRKLRRLAADDHIVKTAGVVGYAQAVLVPELAVRLVKEDLGVDDEAARQILRDTIDIGEKLNYAPNDTVPVPETEE
ncbi:hypothetical protein BO71DRAFT_398994 [Aspergillus ellipticus CBS 707.79]|uniref:Restriction of telomere capping protein 4 n=1 Tax=Aspergillus ellipticus CBS 707.79 TaxID=1448320 RepID=A0A319E141_9EURO|nr:hypothetical protein BO71DRAFT_398994 [Aspergillus ellipticus CBS 707.79]